MATSNELHHLFNKFLNYYSKTIFAVEKIRVNTTLQTYGMLNGCIKLIDETCSITNGLQWNSDEFNPIYMALAGMLEHLRNLRKEISSHLENHQVLEQESVGEFDSALSSYNEIISEVNKMQMDPTSETAETLSIGVKKIDEMCLMTIEISMNQENFNILWIAACGIYEHLQNLKKDIYRQIDEVRQRVVALMKNPDLKTYLIVGVNIGAEFLFTVINQRTWGVFNGGIEYVRKYLRSKLPEDTKEMWIEQIDSIDYSNIYNVGTFSIGLLKNKPINKNKSIKQKPKK